jgi:hypothetical protein
MNPDKRSRAFGRAGLGPSASARLGAAALAVSIAAIHILDQDGFPGSKEPGYIQIGYYLLELGSLLVAAALISPASRLLLRTAWPAAVFLAAGPLLGYAISRGPGLPAYTDDRGNWTEPLGVISLAVESALLVLSVGAIIRRGKDATTNRPVGHVQTRARLGAG